MFAGYAIYRGLYFTAFEAGSHILDIRLGAMNTAVLLGSSLTMALSVCAAQTGNRRALVTFLILTMILGGIFLGVKAYEYDQKFVEHVVPSLDWAPEGENLAHLSAGGLGPAQLYFFFYFAMTGLWQRHPHDHRRWVCFSCGWSSPAGAREHLRLSISRRSKSSAYIGTSSILSGFSCFRYSIS